jgi:Cu/Ag efflux protein CusF
MKHILNRLFSAVVILAFAASLAGAQTAPAPPSTPTAPGALGPQGAPTPMSASPPQETRMDGPVKQVDPLAKTVSVGWLFGLLSTTLEVTEDTRIVVEGATGSLADIQEGDLVKAAYEAHDGKNVAKSIEVTESEARRGAGTPPQRAPAASSSPAMGAAPGADAPAPGAPKTPH